MSFASMNATVAPATPPPRSTRPKLFDEIFKYNDVQLFDLQEDPQRAHDLALDREKDTGTYLRMNGLLDELMAKKSRSRWRNSCHSGPSKA